MRILHTMTIRPDPCFVWGPKLCAEREDALYRDLG